MEEMNRMKNPIIRIQKILAYVSVVFALLIFIMALGFMTNLHVLLFDGDFEMYEYYKSIQVLVRAMFNISLFYVIYAFLLLPFDINKQAPGYFGMALVAGGTVFTIIRSFTMFRYVPYFQAQYEAFDFSIIEGYTPSPWQFDLVKVMFGFWDVLAIALVIVCSLNFLKALKVKRKSMEAVSYES